MSTTITHPPDVMDRYCTNLIRMTARDLITGGVFPRRDYEDIVQELRMALVVQAANFDPERAKWSTFAKTVVRLSAITLRRRQNAGRRRGEQIVGSLHDLTVGEDDQLVELAETLPESQRGLHMGQEQLSHTVRIELSLDVSCVIDQLPSELRELCECLKHQTLTEAARQLGVPRMTLVHWLGKIREEFAAAEAAS